MYVFCKISIFGNTVNILFNIMWGSVYWLSNDCLFKLKCSTEINNKNTSIFSNINHKSDH